jgi:hypothetical protein
VNSFSDLPNQQKWLELFHRALDVFYFPPAVLPLA